MIKYKVVAQDDLNVFPHTWTKGLDYEVLERTDSFTLASNEGQLNFLNKRKDEVLNKFVKI